VAELQQAQKRRRRRTRVVPVVIAAVILAVVLAIVTSSGGSSKKVTTSGTSTTAAGSSTTAAGSPTTAAAPGTTLAPGTGTGLVAHPAPAISASCNTPAGGAPGSGAAPASGHGVSIVPAPAHVPFPKLDGSSPRYTKFSAAPPFCIDTTKTYTVTLVTDIGPVAIKMLPKDAPTTVNNFIFLAGYHFYDGIVFQRVIPGFVVQGGDPTGTGAGGPGYTFKDELPSSNAAYGTGSVAMANSGPNTNGSQFFVVVPGGGSQLQPLYSVFGQVTSGLPVVEQINKDGSQSGTPTKYHKIVKVTIAET
jgi:cyclophilin family peptidyl-prolyl cis-trans isomerase